jgi:hypothetical protein
MSFEESLRILSSAAGRHLILFQFLVHIIHRIDFGLGTAGLGVSVPRFRSISASAQRQASR